jgi:F-type H+-transporting ATPase subunit b
MVPRFITALALIAVVFAGDVHAASEGGEGGGIVAMIAKFLNFAILAGVLVYFLRTPLATYLASRSTQIRQELVTAADMKASASQHLTQIEQKMRALPGELETLKARGAEDVKAERVRITQAATAERDRLLDQTRREIDSRLRIAKRELTAHAAELAVAVARRRIEQSITPDDQSRLVDRTHPAEGGAMTGARRRSARALLDVALKRETSSRSAVIWASSLTWSRRTRRWHARCRIPRFRFEARRRPGDRARRYARRSCRSCSCCWPIATGSSCCRISCAPTRIT